MLSSFSLFKLITEWSCFGLDSSWSQSAFICPWCCVTLFMFSGNTSRFSYDAGPTQSSTKAYVISNILPASGYQGAAFLFLKRKEVNVELQIILVVSSCLTLFPSPWTVELNHKEGWVPKNWCFWTVVLEKTLESPLDSKEIKAVHPEGDQSRVFIGRTDAEVEGPIFWLSGIYTWRKELAHWKRPWCWEGLRARKEGGNRGWNGLMASLTQWTWVWANTGK